MYGSYIYCQNIVMKSAYISIQSPLENGKKRQENNSQISLECELTNCHNASAGLRYEVVERSFCVVLSFLVSCLA